MHQKLLFSMFLITTVSGIMAQYKPPLYMGFLMPKKYVRNLTNMQSKTKANCGSVCSQQMLGSQFPFNNNQNLQVAENLFTNNFPSQQFNSYNTNNNLLNSDSKSLPKVSSNFQQPWEKPSLIKNFLVPNFIKNEPQTMAITKPSCCNQQSAGLGDLSNSYPSNFMATYNQPKIALNNPYSNALSHQIDSYADKSQWDTTKAAYASSSSFDQWIRQQPQEGPYVLYTSSQLQQRGTQPANFNKFGASDAFSANGGRITGMYFQGGKMGFD